jgi:predicted secreted protein
MSNKYFSLRNISALVLALFTVQTPLAHGAGLKELLSNNNLAAGTASTAGSDVTLNLTESAGNN